jgi:DNA-binding NarL/FixJ family response regulator
LGCEVLVAARSLVFAEGISTLLRMAGMTARSVELEAIVDASDASQPTVLVVDDEGGQEILPDRLARLRERSPGCQVLLIVRDPTHSSPEAVAATGATAWVSCHADSNVLIESVHALTKGRSVGRSQGSHVPPSNRRSPPTDLTHRELTVLDLLTRAVSNEAIAQVLGISQNTVRTHVHNVLSKLNVHSRAGAIALASQPGFLSASVPSET